MNGPWVWRGMGKFFFYGLILLIVAVFGPHAGGTSEAKAAVAPVGQLPAVTVSLTPSVYALPVLLVERQGEWKDFGIQVTLKIHAGGEDQLERLATQEWEVAVMDPWNAVKGGNEGNVAIVGVAGDFSRQLPFLLQRNGPSGSRGKWAQGLKGFLARAESRGEKAFLPACLVAAANYADTRKTLVLRWLEGYSRGIRIIEKNREAAASRLKEFYRETLKEEIPGPLLRQEIEEAFYFNEKDREEPFRGKESRLQEFAKSMTRYLEGLKALDSPGEPSDYILFKLCDQLSALRGEAMSQLEKTGESIEEAARAGAQVSEFRKAWDEARIQIQEGRGCLTVIGVLSDLQRSADQSRLSGGRLREFRRIEMAAGGILALYYAGYFIHRRRKPGRWEG